MNAVHERIELQVTLKPLDLFWLHLSRSSGAGIGFYIRRLLASAVFLFLAFLTDQFSPFGSQSRIILPYLFSGLSVFSLLLWPYLAAAADVRRLAGASGVARYVFSEGGADVIGSDFQTHHDWQEIRRAKQTASLILLFDAKGIVIALPKRCILEERQAFALRELLTRKVARR
jgi:hypothetical protein